MQLRISKSNILAFPCGAFHSAFLPLHRCFLFHYFVHLPSAHKSICINLQIPKRNNIIYNISWQDFTRQLRNFAQLFNLFVLGFREKYFSKHFSGCAAFASYYKLLQKCFITKTKNN